MSRVHDMGGRFGDGAVVPEAEDGPKFSEEWHRGALSLTLACGTLGLWNIDVSRHARESLAPTDYARFTYYEKWTAALVNLLVDTGAITREELVSGAAGVSELAERALKAENVEAVLAKGGPVDRPSDIAPVFKAGDAVQTRKAGNGFVAGGHTRLPGYAARTPGRILRYHGTHVLPDSSGHRLGEAPEPLYAVAFRAGDLWQEPEHQNDEVVLDLWQSYLETA